MASMGQELGAHVRVPATQVLISSFGWRWTYIAAGSLLLLVLVPLNAVFQRRMPTDVGQFPDGAAEPAVKAVVSQGKNRPVARDWSLGEALLSLPFWCIAFGHL